MVLTKLLITDFTQLAMRSCFRVALLPFVVLAKVVPARSARYGREGRWGRKQLPCSYSAVQQLVLRAEEFASAIFPYLHLDVTCLLLGSFCTWSAVALVDETQKAKALSQATFRTLFCGSQKNSSSL